MTTEEILKITLYEISGFKCRDVQLVIGSAIENTLAKGNHFIGQAPTGSGKTIAYAVPIILYSLQRKKKVIISTGTKALQWRIYKEDLPYLKRALPEFKAALCMGGENYLCLSRLSNIRQLGLFNDDETQDIERILDRQAYITSRYDLGYTVKDILWDKICRHPYTCNAACTHRSSCNYLLNLRHQEKANVLVANHNFTLAQIRNSSRLLDSVGAIVFDEAHDLEKVAVDVFSHSIESADIQRMLTELYDPRSRDSIITKLRLPRELQRTIETSVSATLDFIFAMKKGAEGSTNMTKEDVELLRQLQIILGRLSNSLKRTNVALLLAYCDRIVNVITTTDKICSFKRQDIYLYWKSFTSSGWSYKLSPIFPADILRKKLFEPKKITTIHVSATISLNGNMSFYKKNIGLDEADELTVASPFNFRRQAAIYIPQNMPHPKDQDAYLAAVARESEALIQHFDGRTLILCTSDAFMNGLSNRLESHLQAYNFLKQKLMPEDELIRMFKSQGKAVLLGLNTFWTGIDIPGDDLKCVIITKIPFMVPSDPLTLARKKALTKRGVNFYRDYYQMRAFILLLQGFGRLIRTASDTGVVAILDPRLKTKYSIFLKWLPDCPIVNSIDAVRKLKL